MVNDTGFIGPSALAVGLSRVISRAQEKNSQSQIKNNVVRPIEIESNSKPDEIYKIPSSREEQSSNEARFDSSAASPPSSRSVIKVTAPENSSLIDTASIENNNQHTNTVSEELNQRETKQARNLEKSETGNSVDRFA